MFRIRLLTRVLSCSRNHLITDYVHPGIAPRVELLKAREQSTVAIEDSYVKKFMKAVGWMDQFRTRLKLTGYFLYESVPDNVQYHEWAEKLKLPDTFATWFAITELHVWLLLVRYMAEDIKSVANEKKKYVKGDGHFVRNCIIEALWADVGNRIKLLEGANPAIARKQVTELSEQFQAALVAYDEGLSDDRILASAIWRRIFMLDPDTQPEHIESVVHFIRHQIAELDKIPSEKLQQKTEIPWLSILDH
ncbi:ubiquinol-cytochrome-c reductase complex assembly factor 1 [Pectinophora gossypiella]|uniref:ubiquinol-cytochrome-c reductase complex assembly factor 1 n=1 Tax=Pectinophora gossypiella TaxID=13191 RepID=UPI00214E38A3|nr:ubiquinol-cytochrome-c reductase complex assembly factor 1 [Pectinophora gossypiella]